MKSPIYIINLTGGSLLIKTLRNFQHSWTLRKYSYTLFKINVNTCSYFPAFLSAYARVLMRPSVLLRAHSLVKAGNVPLHGGKGGYRHYDFLIFWYRLCKIFGYKFLAIFTFSTKIVKFGSVLKMWPIIFVQCIKNVANNFCTMY